MQGRLIKMQGLEIAMNDIGAELLKIDVDKMKVYYEVPEERRASKELVRVKNTYKNMLGLTLMVKYT